MKTKIITIGLVISAFIVNAQDSQKTLADAINSGNIENVKNAVEHQKADVNKPYKDKLFNNPPISTACFALNVDAVNYLLEKGADPNAENKFGQTPLMVVCNSFYSDSASFAKINKIIKALASKSAKLNETGGGGFSALAYAASHNNLLGVKTLLELKADPNARKGKINESALMYAAQKGNLEMVKALVEAGANLNDIKEHADGNTLITENAATMASDGKFNDVLDYLVSKGAKAPKGRSLGGKYKN